MSLLIPKILILEDEETFILRFKIILQKVGISTQEFKSFKNWKKMLESIAEEFPDVIFIDLKLKGNDLDGLSVLKEVKRQYNGKLRIGIISTSDSLDDIKQASLLGAKFYIVKSGKIDVFTERLTKFKKDFLEQTVNQNFMIYN